MNWLLQPPPPSPPATRERPKFTEPPLNPFTCIRPTFAAAEAYPGDQQGNGKPVTPQPGTL